MKPLVIFEIANNHMGDLAHAKKIIGTYFRISKNYKSIIDFAVKFQFRDLETFINPKFKDTNHNQVKRFVDTKLSNKEWDKLISFSKKKFKIICTAFDEKSVEQIVKKNFDFLKIASCSMDEWPLLEHISKKARKKKIICSLGGASLEEIRKTVSFFSNRKMDVSYLYCVAKYPTNPQDLNLSFFNYLKDMYKGKIKGFSSHEIPEEKLSASLAYAMGAKIFEKHVGLKTNKYNLNKYSTSPEQMLAWLENLKLAIERCGSIVDRKKFLPNEKENLLQFKRGIFLKKDISKKKGDLISRKDIEFSFPASKGQFTSNEFSKFKKIYAKSNIHGGEAILRRKTESIFSRDKIETIRLKVINLIEKSKVVLLKNTRLEISHHYGIKLFNKYGMVMVTILNSIYCKKLLFLFFKQKHPKQYHKKKQETFFILYGKVKVSLTKNSRTKTKILKAGDILTIMPNEIHSFSGMSKEGAVIEELSTTSTSKDSYYIDPKIENNKKRKSFISLT